MEPHIILHHGEDVYRLYHSGTLETEKKVVHLFEGEHPEKGKVTLRMSTPKGRLRPGHTVIELNVGGKEYTYTIHRGLMRQVIKTLEKGNIEPVIRLEDVKVHFTRSVLEKIRVPSIYTRLKNFFLALESMYADIYKIREEGRLRR